MTGVTHGVFCDFTGHGHAHKDEREARHRCRLPDKPWVNLCCECTTILKILASDMHGLTLEVTELEVDIR